MKDILYHPGKKISEPVPCTGSFLHNLYEMITKWIIGRLGVVGVRNNMVKYTGGSAIYLLSAAGTVKDKIQSCSWFQI